MSAETPTQAMLASFLALVEQSNKKLALRLEKKLEQLQLHLKQTHLTLREELANQLRQEKKAALEGLREHFVERTADGFTFDDALKEWEDRDRRRLNLILYGLSGTDAADTHDSRVRLAHDTLSSIAPGISPPLSAARLTSSDPQRPRPLLVRLASEQDHRSVLDNAKQFHSKGTGVRVRVDRTRRQRQEEQRRRETGWEKFEGKCRQPEHADPQFKCKEGKLIGNKCEIKSKKPATKVCDKDWKLSDEGKCVWWRDDTPELVCPRDFWLKDNRICIRKFKKDISLKCPDQFTMEGDRCKRVEKEYPPRWDCNLAAGEELVGEYCIKKIYADPIPFCDIPHFQLINGRCVRRLEKNTVCEDGFEKRGNRCAKDVITDAVCPRDTYMKGNSCCRVVDTRDPTPVCDHPFVLHPGSNRCVHKRKVPAKPKCHEGYHIDGTYCVKEFVEDPVKSCGPKGKPSPEKPEYCVGEEWGAVYWKPKTVCLRGHLVDGKCKGLFHKPIEYECDADGDLQGKVCIFTDYKDPRPTCPNGYDLKGNVCKKIDCSIRKECERGVLRGDKCIEVIFKDPICKVGKLENDKCVVLKKKDPAVKCARPFYLTADKTKCVKKEKRQADKKCGEGKLVDNRVCRVYKYEDKVPFCADPEFRLNRKQTKCVKRVKEQPKKVCKAPFKLEGNRCVHHEAKGPNFVCEGDEYKLDGQTCHKKELVPATPFCQKGHLVGHKCLYYRMEPTKPVCKEHFKLIGHKCVKWIKKRPTPGCDDGWKLQGRYCCHVH